MNSVLQYTNELNELPYFMIKYDQSCIVGQYNSFIQLKKESSASNDSSQIYPTKVRRRKVTINDVVRIVYFHVCDIGVETTGLKRKQRNCLWKCMKHKIKSFMPLWRNPSHTEMRKKEYVNYQLLYFIIFYAILL